jgi:hypothetical protein
MDELNEFEYIKNALNEKVEAGEKVIVPEEGLEDSAYNVASKEDVDMKPSKKRAAKKKVSDEPELFDISQINIVEKNPIDKNRAIRNMYSGKPEFQIVAPQSGYTCTLSPLVNQDIVSIMNSSSSWYVYQKNLYKIIYDKLGNLPNNIGFDQWCQITSIEDIETFFYGIYSVTFPSDNNIGFDCEECGEEVNVKIDAKQISQVSDAKEFKKHMDDIVKNVKDLEDVRTRSMLLQEKPYRLPESGTIVKLKTPSLYDHLEILRTVPESALKKDEMSTTYLLYINTMLIPDEAGNYFQEHNKTSILGIVDLLSIDDARYLKKALAASIDHFKISFSIKNVTCPVCNHVNEKVDMDM